MNISDEFSKALYNKSEIEIANEHIDELTAEIGEYKFGMEQRDAEIIKLNAKIAKMERNHKARIDWKNFLLRTK